MSTHPTAVRDLDHVVMTDGRIYRVVGNLDHPAKFVGYNVYSPDPAGGRLFRSTPYRKNFTEDDELPQDALDTYVMLPKARIREHLDPRTAAAVPGPEVDAARYAMAVVRHLESVATTPELRAAHNAVEPAVTST